MTLFSLANSDKMSQTTFYDLKEMFFYLVGNFEGGGSLSLNIAYTSFTRAILLQEKLSNRLLRLRTIGG